jgi:hypothetical protein
LEQRSGSIFRVKEYVKQETSIKQAEVLFFVSSILKMDSVCSAKMSLDFSWTTQLTSQKTLLFAVAASRTLNPALD